MNPRALGAVAAADFRDRVRRPAFAVILLDRVNRAAIRSRRGDRIRRE